MYKYKKVFILCPKINQRKENKLKKKVKQTLEKFGCDRQNLAQAIFSPFKLECLGNLRLPHQVV